MLPYDPNKGKELVILNLVCVIAMQKLSMCETNQIYNT